MDAHHPTDSSRPIPGPQPTRPDAPVHRRRSLLRLVVALTAVLVTLLMTSAGTSAGTSANASNTSPATSVTKSKPTIVLVHGAFADSSGWSAVAGRLLNNGYKVIAFSNPLRNPQADGEYLRQFLSTISGPVVLVGHSYGGAVITNGATGTPNVKSLVYVAAYALDRGETVQAANDLGGGHTDVTNHLIVRPYPGAPAGDADAYIDPAFFHQPFAQDVPHSARPPGRLLSQRRLLAEVWKPGYSAPRTGPARTILAARGGPRSRRGSSRRVGGLLVFHGGRWWLSWAGACPPVRPGAASPHCVSRPLVARPGVSPAP
jgi:pimeloyl-ACP methyl ester carboxylesterase